MNTFKKVIIFIVTIAWVLFAYSAIFSYLLHVDFFVLLDTAIRVLVGLLIIILPVIMILYYYSGLKEK